MGSRRGRSGLGRQGACALAALLLWLRLPPLSAQNLSAICGKSNLVLGKIFGGHQSVQGRWPWQASLVYRNQHICGAFLINREWVISSASCVQRSRNVSDYIIWLGYFELGAEPEYTTKRRIDGLFVHEEYNRQYPKASDISIMHLSESVKFTYHIRPVCMPGRGFRFNRGFPCYMIGWGKINETHALPAPFKLQMALVMVLEDQECRAAHPIGQPANRHLSYREDNVCAQHPTVPKSFCEGDTGSPLNCFIDHRFYAIGIASWGGRCHPPLKPSVFINIQTYHRWIEEKQRWIPPSTRRTTTRTTTKRPRPPRKPRTTVIMTTTPDPLEEDAGVMHRPRVFLVLLSSATLLLPILLQSQ